MHVCAFVCPADKNQTLKDRQNELKVINVISFWHQTLCEPECRQRTPSIRKFQTGFHSSVSRTAPEEGEKIVQSNGFEFHKPKKC